MSECTYWRHVWTGTCHTSENKVNWGTSMWEEITEEEYEDWVWERRAVWTWPKEDAREELGLELL